MKAAVPAEQGPAPTSALGTISSMLRRRIRGLDNLFLVAERPEHLMAIAGCWRFAVPPRPEDVHSTFQHLVERFPRFGQRAHAVFGGFGYWEDMPAMDVSDHIVSVPLYPSGQPGSDPVRDEEQLKLVLGDLMSKPLDRSRPLWVVYDIRGFADGSSALHVKIHHCIADGQGSIRAVLTMASTEGVDLRQMQYGQAEKQLRELEQKKSQAKKQKTFGSRIAVIFKLLLSVVMLLVGLAYVNLQYLGIALHRKRSNKTLLTTKKAVTWSKSVSLDDIKVIKNAFGVTVNDVLVAALTAAFRSYLIDTDQLLEDDVLALIPVSLRSLDDWEMGNKVAVVWLYFPVSEQDPVQRLRTVHSRMERLKKIPAAPIGYYTTRLLGAIPGFFNNPLALSNFRWWAAKAHCVMTNVPGPKLPLIMAGQKITSYLPFVPQSGDGGVGVSLISYCDQVNLSVLSDVGQLATASAKTDKPVVPLEQAFYDELQHLKALAVLASSTSQESKKAK